MIDTETLILALGGLGAFITAMVGAYKIYADSRREDRKSELERTEIAAKLGVEVHQSANKMLTDFAERQKKSLDDAHTMIIELQKENLSRAEEERKKDLEIARLKEQQQRNTEEINKLSKELLDLRSDNESKDKVIEEQGKKIQELEEENGQLKKRQQELENEYKRVKTQVALLVKKLKDAELPLPDGVEHEESGGGA